MKLRELQKYTHKDTIVDLVDNWDAERGWLGTFFSKMIPEIYLDNEVIKVYPEIYKGIGGEETELAILVKENKDDS